VPRRCNAHHEVAGIRSNLVRCSDCPTSEYWESVQIAFASRAIATTGGASITCASTVPATLLAESQTKARRKLASLVRPATMVYPHDLHPRDRAPVGCRNAGVFGCRRDRPHDDCKAVSRDHFQVLFGRHPGSVASADVAEAGRGAQDEAAIGKTAATNCARGSEMPKRSVTESCRSAKTLSIA
jgi:hypothetical protein